MIQTEKLDCPSCGAELLDPIYDLEMVDGGRRRLTCEECGRPFTVTASLVYDVTADGEPAASPLADAVLAAFRLTDGEVSIVELNGMMNAGLFALDMDALTRAMRARPGQFVPVSLGGLLADRDACPVPV